VQSPPTLSAILITKNEALDVGTCLASISGWTDEIIVLDCGSVDGTQDICRSFGARVVETDWPGFGVQKQRALDLCTSDWILSIDADEYVSESLRDEIVSQLTHSESAIETAADAYALHRKSSYCDVWINHTGWGNDYVTRLFKRDGAAFSDDAIHEKVLLKPAAVVRRMNGALMHNSFRDFEEVLQKINDYSSLGARRSASKRKRGGIAQGLLHGGWTFIRSYLLQRGFLDGGMGLILSISNAQGAFYKYLKINPPGTMPPRG
jgi:glycosyltransferase involved in cell wall biosynthesis